MPQAESYLHKKIKKDVNIGSPELTHLVTESLCPVTNVSSVPPSQQRGGRSELTTLHHAPEIGLGRRSYMLSSQKN